jgi:signal transduction histidine kinase
MSSALLYIRLSLPSDGWSYHSGAIGGEDEDTITYATNILGQPSPLQPGDFLLAVEGHSFRHLVDNALRLQPALIDDWGTKTTARYTVRRSAETIELDVPLYRWRWLDVAGLALANSGLLVRLANFGIGLFVLLQRPAELAARLLFVLTAIWLTFEISNIVYWSVPEIVHPPFFFAAIIFSNWIYGMLAAPTLLLLTLSFPQPKAFFRRPLLFSLAVYSVLPLLLLLFGAQPFLGWGWTATCGLLGLISVGHSIVNARDAQSRAQLRWAGLGVLCIALSVLIGSTSGFGIYPPLLRQFFGALDPLLLLAFPLTLAIAILRYRLFDIDLILSRALVYGALTLCVIGLYVGIVSYLGALLRSEDNLIASLIATGIVAVAFQPLRAWLQRGVERLLFGQRDEPYRVIATLGRQLEGSGAPHDVYSAIVATIGQSLKLPYVAISNADEAQPRAVFQAPDSPAPIQFQRLPLSYNQQPLGTLIVALRSGEAQFAQAEQKLLADLTRQSAIAVYAAQLTAALQRSRERIVHAREEERRRLRRDLHDGLGPQLASQALTLDVVAKRLRDDPERAAALLLAAREQMQQAVGDIRDLIYGLRPPVLDDLGLNGAIAEFVDRLRQQPASPQFNLQLPPQETHLPAAVEVAAYRIVQEALTNVLRHAHAKTCTIHMAVSAASATLSTAGEPAQLRLTISDDGVGIAADQLSGVGLQSMRERSEELGGQLTITAERSGGTRIVAVLPIAEVHHEHHDPDR